MHYAVLSDSTPTVQALLDAGLCKLKRYFCSDTAYCLCIVNNVFTVSQLVYYTNFLNLLVHCSHFSEYVYL